MYILAVEDMLTTTEHSPLGSRGEKKRNHLPVMMKEVVECLCLRPGICVVDCTLGLAGHALKIAEIIGPQGRLVGIDRDAASLKKADEVLKSTRVKYDLIQEDFRRIDRILHQLGIEAADAILFDLGISSFQLDDPQRGFSFKSEGPLDMRMDRGSYISAFDLVNSLSERELASILKNFGEERWHQRIARFLVSQRARRPIESTRELCEVVLKAVPFRFQHQKIHPATRTFQAFRIAVNRELEALEIALDKSIDLLRVGGRICVISFHSLEDRIVKGKFRSWGQSGRASIITKKPLRPQDEEAEHNPRSRSARLRVAERTA